MDTFLQRFKRFCGIVVGIVFFLSGLAKIMDPVGTGLIMSEYFDFFNLNTLIFPFFAAKCLGTLLALTEILTGIALITGVWRKFMARFTSGLQIFFTLLTLIFVIFEPEMDCGCFGEVIELTHAQTFAKNLLLLALILASMPQSNEPVSARKKKYVMFFIVSIPALALTIYSWLYIPLVDFTDYKPGAELAAGVEISPEDMYETVFTYEKDGQKQTFTLENLPDSTWTYVSTETHEKKGTERLIVNLSFYDRDGQDMDILATEGKVMIISIYDHTFMSQSSWNQVEDFMQRSKKAGFTTFLLCTRPEIVPSSLAEDTYTSDYKTLVSLNRSNGGVTYFNDGVLIRKWAEIAAPDAEELHEVYTTDATEVSIDRESKGSLTMQGFLLYAFVFMFLI